MIHTENKYDMNKDKDSEFITIMIMIYNIKFYHLLFFMSRFPYYLILISIYIFTPLNPYFIFIPGFPYHLDFYTSRF